MRSVDLAPVERLRACVTTAFFALVFVAFTCVEPFCASVNNPNENVRTYMTMAIVHDHTFRIDKIVEKYGWVNDMATVPEGLPPGGLPPNASPMAYPGPQHLYSVKAPAISYAGVPFYWAMTKIAPRFGMPVPDEKSSTAERERWFRAATFVMRLFAVQIPCFAFLVWLERWLRGVTGDLALRLSAVAAAGLGTNYLGYALMFASHAPFACAAFASFAITTRERELHPLDASRRRLSRAFLAGFFAGLATQLEYHAFPVSVLLSLYALGTFWRPLRLAVFGLGGLVNVAGLTLFQWRAFKNPLTPGHRFSENPLFQHQLSQGLYGIEKPDFEVFKSISLDRGYGFFGTSPFMWLGLLAIGVALFPGRAPARERRQRRVATVAWMIMMLALWVTVSAANNWRGGWTVGPRYLGAAPPFFAYGALCALERFAGLSPARRAIARGIAGGAMVASVVSIGLVGLHYNTLPDDITRPLMQFTWPLARVGIVPWHVMQLFGVDAAGPWFVVAACALVAALGAALVPWRERRFTWPVRAVTFAGALAVAMLPALSVPAPEDRRDLGQNDRGYFLGAWAHAAERVDAVHDEAERFGPRRPCAWLHAARVETMFNRRADSQRDFAKAGDPPPVCKGLEARVDEFLLRHVSLAEVSAREAAAAQPAQPGAKR